MTVYMFPGQGAQQVGMGEDLFNAFPDYVDKANAILGYDIASLCLNDLELNLHLTQYTQPAIYLIEVLAYLQKQKTATKPTYCIGHSLGEYAALFASEVFDFETGLRLVQKRGELMSKEQNGGLLAVIGNHSDVLKRLLTKPKFYGIDVANINTPRQIVLSGLIDDLAAFQIACQNQNLKSIPLSVSGAFHSRYMQDAADQFAYFMRDFQLNSCQIPVIANYSAQPYTDMDIKLNLVKQITNPVRWSETIHYLKQQQETDFVELGPGTVLTKMMAHF